MGFGYTRKASGQATLTTRPDPTLALTLDPIRSRWAAVEALGKLEPMVLTHHVGAQ